MTSYVLLCMATFTKGFAYKGKNLVLDGYILSFNPTALRGHSECSRDKELTLFRREAHHDYGSCRVPSPESTHSPLNLFLNRTNWPRSKDH